MAVSYKGLVIKFGGDTTGLQDALKSVQKQARNAQSNLRDVNRELKFDPSNADLLELKMNALNKSVEETKKQLDMYKQALQQLESKKQSGAKLTAQEEAQYDSLKLAIVRCERQLDSYGTELADTARQAEGSKTAIGKLGQAIEDNADSISSAGSKVSSAGTAISGGVVGAATALTGLAASQEEAIQQSGQLETAWVSAGGTAEQASSTYAMFYRILGQSDTATEASQNLARLTTNEQELQQWTNMRLALTPRSATLCHLKTSRKPRRRRRTPARSRAVLPTRSTGLRHPPSNGAPRFPGTLRRRLPSIRRSQKARRRKTRSTPRSRRAAASRSVRSSSPRRLPGFMRTRGGSTKRRTKTFSLRATRRTR